MVAVTPPLVTARATVAAHHLLADPQRLRHDEAAIRREERVLGGRVQRLRCTQRARRGTRRVVGCHRLGRHGMLVAGIGRGSDLLQVRDRDIEQVGVVVNEHVLHRLGLRLPRCRVVRQHLIAIVMNCALRISLLWLPLNSWFIHQTSDGSFPYKLQNYV